ncbi:MAG TPA: DUF2642 domain-containing protein [Bacillales bacterium]
MKEFENHLGKLVKIEISGNIVHHGRLVDCGLDILVIYNGRDYLYIPSLHIQHFKENIDNDELESQISGKTESPISDDLNKISYRKILGNAKGGFVEIYVTGKQTIHGYITNIMNDYFTFYSPVYKTMFISMDHMKWLMPYNSVRTPYSLKKDQLPVIPSSISLSRTLEEQLKKIEGKLVVFDIAENPDKIGLLQKIENKTIELITAREERIYLNQRHLKTVHMPWLE